jgi:hypothetical protein
MTAANISFAIFIVLTLTAVLAPQEWEDRAIRFFRNLFKTS